LPKKIVGKTKSGEDHIYQSKPQNYDKKNLSHTASLAKKIYG
jgi:hypothetical protein